MVDQSINAAFDVSQYKLSPELTKLQLQLREQFPFIINNEKLNQSFFENAGGSAVPTTVITAVQQYYTDNYVQLGAGYSASQRADTIVNDAHKFINQWMNNNGSGETILSDSTSRLMQMLSDCYTELTSAQDEIIISENAHEVY